MGMGWEEMDRRIIFGIQELLILLLTFYWLRNWASVNIHAPPSYGVGMRCLKTGEADHSPGIHWEPSRTWDTSKDLNHAHSVAVALLPS